jgi:membrane protein implicated in regulation of membrane protease activity
MALDWISAAPWWLVAGVLVAAELATGTFYLLMLALGAAAGAITAHLGPGLPIQLAVAAVAGSAATTLCYLRRRRQPRAAPTQRNSDVHLDIGSALRVPKWQADQSARVNYRGAPWTVRFAGPGLPEPGEHVIVAVQGSDLLVAAAAQSREAP